MVVIWLGLYVRYTAASSEAASQKVIYAVLLDWPNNNTVILGALESAHVSTVEMLGLNGKGFKYVIYFVNILFFFLRCATEILISFWWAASEPSNNPSIFKPNASMGT